MRAPSFSIFFSAVVFLALASCGVLPNNDKTLVKPPEKKSAADPQSLVPKITDLTVAQTRTGIILTAYGQETGKVWKAKLIRQKNNASPSNTLIYEFQIAALTKTEEKSADKMEGVEKSTIIGARAIPAAQLAGIETIQVVAKENARSVKLPRP